jgi:hypothetical protein
LANNDVYSIWQAAENVPELNQTDRRILAEYVRTGHLKAPATLVAWLGLQPGQLDRSISKLTRFGLIDASPKGSRNDKNTN